MKRVLFIFLLWATAANAEVRLQLDGVPDSLLIGDPLKLTLTVEAPADGQLKLPDWNESLDPFELLAPPDTVASSVAGDIRRLTLELQVTCYLTGDQVFQPIPVTWKSPDEARADSAETEPHIVFVRGVVPDSILALADTTTQKHHLLQPNRQVRVGYTLADFIPWALILVGLVVVFLLLRWWIRKRKKPAETVAAGPPPRPPDEIALEELDTLRDRQLYQKGKIKEYYSELSGILRRYFEARYGIPALESTSFQLLRDMERPLGDGNLHGLLKAILEDADLAKFAKHRPDEDTCREDLQNAYILVNRTKPAPKPISAEEAA